MKGCEWKDKKKKKKKDVDESPKTNHTEKDVDKVSKLLQQGCEWVCRNPKKLEKNSGKDEH